MEKSIKNEDIYNFENGDELSDLKLIVEDKELYAHKAILATASPVFKKMLTLDFKEKKESVVRLPDKKLADIVLLLKMIYPDQSKDIRDDQIETLLELTEEYSIVFLKNKIERRLIDGLSSEPDQKKMKLYGKAIENQLNHLVDLIFLSVKFRLYKLKSEAMSVIAKKFNRSQLDKNENFPLLDQSIRFEVYAIKLSLLEEQLKQKEVKLKQLQDENLKQKFEIQHLKNRNVQDL